MESTDAKETEGQREIMLNNQDGGMEEYQQHN